MALTEDLSVFLSSSGFGIPVTAGAISGFGILDMPSEIIADGIVLTTDYKLTCETSKFGDLAHGAGINVDGHAYTVRNVAFIDDGAFCELMLQRTATPEQSTSDDAVLDGDSVDTTSTVIMDGGSPSTTYIAGNILDSGPPG